MRSPPAAFLLPLLALVLGAGCVKTKKTTYVDPDAYGAVEGTGIEARDVRAVASQMARDLLASPIIQAFQGAPRIAVIPVKNRSRFLIDQNIFTTLITDILIQNSAGKLAILNRDIVDQIMKEREMKRAGQVDSAGMKAMAGADYFLEGEIQSLSASTSEAQSDYVVIRFQLTDAETGIVGWSSSFQMKKEGSWGVMYQ
jgi:PBP1b-binding outer membrane lipoprotein LpoB